MRPQRLAVAVVLAVVAAGCAGAATPAPSAAPISSPSSSPAGLASSASPGANEILCDLGGHDGKYHIHSLVGVKVDGQLYAPPANIGIGQTCMYWVHTHKTDGIVHVEAPATVAPTLGDFIDLWASTYPDDQVLAQARAAIAAGQVTVNDEPYDGNALELALADQLRIILGG
jgi:hypothetical protein